MLQIIKSSIFDSPAQTLVNTVNTIGVMGKGIAKEFKRRYPLMFKEYKQICDERLLEVGALHCWRGPNRWVVNFPTKTTWRKPSTIEYVEEGLDTFRANYKRMGIQSISFPPLGCGNGQLDWEEVRPLMLMYLSNLEIRVFIHEQLQFPQLAEHHEPTAKAPPFLYSEFLSDLHAVIDERHGHFERLVAKDPFRVKLNENSDLEIYRRGKLLIDELFISAAWSALQTGLLTPYTLGSGVSSYANYLLPIIASLPYVRAAPVQYNLRDPSTKCVGLFLNESDAEFERYSLPSDGGAQAWLFQ